MRSFIKTTVLAALILASGSVLYAQVSITIGPPPPPRVIRVLPPSPGPEFVWVRGYWYPVGPHYNWHAGYWTRPPYPGARWIGPRHDGERYFGGYWEGDRGRVEHDHHWDHDRDRDADRHEHHAHYRDADRHEDHDHR